MNDEIISEKRKEWGELPINANYPGMTLWDLMAQGCKRPFYIPMCEPTLSSEFCHGIKWGELIDGLEATTAEINGVRCMPVYLSGVIHEGSKIKLRVVSLFAPSISKFVIIPFKPTPRALSFIFNDKKYDVSELRKEIPCMGQERLRNLKHMVVSDLHSLVDVDYIVTDTNNWVAMDKRRSCLRYQKELERMSKMIKHYNTNAKFYVVSEVITELKRLLNSKDSEVALGARMAQRLIEDEFMQRNLIHIPNPGEEIARNVIADGHIRKHVVDLYNRQKRISVISNDRQAMILWQANIRNIEKNNCVFPKFLNLANISHLLSLLDAIRRREKTVRDRAN